MAVLHRFFDSLGSGPRAALFKGGFYMKKYLIVVDMQRDFIDGALGT